MACLKSTGLRRLDAQYSGPHSLPCSHASHAVERKRTRAARGEIPCNFCRNGSSSESIMGLCDAKLTLILSHFRPRPESTPSALSMAACGPERTIDVGPLNDAIVTPE